MVGIARPLRPAPGDLQPEYVADRRVLHTGPVDDVETEPAEWTEATRWRYEQAREYGLEPWDARRFAESDADIGAMRHLEELGCPPATAFAILY